MRRASFTGVASGGGPGEPLIVVEETEGITEEEEEDEDSKASSPGDSRSVNQYLLTPYRDLRKRSLPTPPCTSGITASQVRRLSERGGEGSGPSPIEQAFLATLSQAPAPQPGARRHSVVTISKVPPPTTLFGRNRRESIAAFASGLPRRDSGIFNQPGSMSRQGSQSGSSFNLQLDIMDDIAEAKAKAKDKRKVSWTPAPTLDEAQKEALKGGPKRRASELPSLSFSPAGIVCTNNDLINLLSPLTSSAGEVGAGSDKEIPNITVNPNTGSPTQQQSLLDKKRKALKDRSNSFDVCALPGPSSNWFTKRHQPMAAKKEETKSVVVTFTDEKPKSSIAPVVVQPDEKPSSPEASKVLWDDNSGSVIDATVIGSAIEVFLTRRSSQGTSGSPKQSPTKPTSRSSWFGTGAKEGTTSTSSGSGSEAEPCQATSSTAPSAASICSTLKDLFVK